MMLGLMSMVSAQNTDLVDALKWDTTPIATSTVIQTLNTQRKDYRLTQATSCEQLQSVFVQRSKALPQYTGYPYPMYATDDAVVAKPEMMEQLSSSSNKDSISNSAVWGGMEMWMSETNVQVAGIDEPDVVKQDSKAVYYFNAEKNIVQIYPHTKLIGKGKIASTIALPETMYGAQLMLSNNQLVVIGTYYDQQRANTTSIIDSSSVTVIAIYDVSNLNKPKLIQHYRAPWYYQDVRLNNNQLTVVSQLGLNLYGLSDNLITWNTSSSTATSKMAWDIMMPYRWYNPKPTSLKDDKGLTNVSLDCTDVRYPTVASGTAPTDLSMTSILTINLDNPTISKSTLIAGNTQTVYMSKDRLYLVGSQYLNDTSSICPINARCIRNPGTSYTQVTSLDPITMTKPQVTRVLGYPLGQYAYHQDSAGKFYLISQGNDVSNEQVTNVWTLDKTWIIAGALLNLEPGEQFKSSRYIDDKLYLVTFEQIDPLFVIDLSMTIPRILWELKIPGYSTYLHPYTNPTRNGKTYLIWLGYDVDTSFGRSVNSGVKLDLYEIDYTKITKWNISIKQIQSNKIGWPGTESEALQNPRMFVYDEMTKTVYLPLVRTIQDKVRFCPTNNEFSKYPCYDNYQDRILFAWYKGITVTPQSIKQTKIVDYAGYYNIYSTTQKWEPIQSRQIQSLNTRVGYAQGQIWYVNNWFMRTSQK